MIVYCSQCRMRVIPKDGLCPSCGRSFQGSPTLPSPDVGQSYSDAVASTEHYSHPCEWERPVKPLGVWILTIYAAVFAGVLPIVIAVMLLIPGLKSDLAAFDAFTLVTTIVLDSCIVGSAIGAFFGNSKARWALIILVSIHYVMIGINNLPPLLSEDLTDKQEIKHFGRVVRGLIFPMIFIWYFTSCRPKKFYSQKPEE